MFNYRIYSSIPEWNSSLLENGELFFIKCSPIIRNSNSKDERSERSLINSSKSNKFSTFLKKRKTKKHVKGGSINKSEKDEKSSTTVKVIFIDLFLVINALEES